MGGVVKELRNKTKLQPSSVEVELRLSLAIMCCCYYGFHNDDTCGSFI